VQKSIYDEQVAEPKYKFVPDETTSTLAVQLQPTICHPDNVVRLDL